MLRPDDELRRLDGQEVAAVPSFPVRLAVTAKDVAMVIDRVREVLRAVVPMTAEELDREAEQPTRLPQWFVDACVPELTPEEAARWLGWWRSLDPEGQVRAEEEKGWTLPDWLYWLTPEERQWHWWDSSVDSDRSATVVVEVPGWPAPLGALRWLLKAAGAESIDVLDSQPR